MILIFSVSRDQATNGVVPWLERLGAPFARINDDEPGRSPVNILLDNDDFHLQIDGALISSADVTSVWYRKGSFWIPSETAAPSFPGQKELSSLIEKKLAAENRRAGEYFHHLVRHKRVPALGNPFLGDPNKLVVLHAAAEVGLKVPKFQVVNRMQPDHLRRPADYVTKAISDGIYLWDIGEAHRGYFTYTEELTEVTSLASDADSLPLSLIQEKIAKSFELRIFFLDGAFAASAIYSQGNPQTAVDYRKYDSEVPNRNLPFELPSDLKMKLRRLFSILDLNTGSVDMIVDEEGEFIFLEINPVGMYGGLADTCNYNIDEVIARWLCGDSHNEGRETYGARDGAVDAPAARIQEDILQGHP